MLGRALRRASRFVARVFEAVGKVATKMGASPVKKTRVASVRSPQKEVQESKRLRTAPGGHKRWSQNMFERANAARRATKPPTPAADEGDERMAAVVALKEFRAAARAEGRSLAAALDEAAEATGYSTAQLYRLNKTYDERVEKYGVASMGRRSGQGRPRKFEQDEQIPEPGISALTGSTPRVNVRVSAP